MKIFKIKISSFTSTLKPTENDLLIYPNPISDGFLKIKNTNRELQQIEILSSVGKIIFSKKIKQRDHEINFSNFSKGIYFVKVWIGDSVQVKKIVW